MRFSQVYRIVFRKEFRELLRDRRALFWLFAPPIILPGIALCGGIFIGSQVARIAEDGLPVAVQNGEQAPELLALFEAEEGVNLVEQPAEGEFGEAVVLVVLPEDFQAQLDQNGTVSIEMITQDVSLLSIFGQGAVRSVINTYNSQLLDQRLNDQGLTRDWLTPITIGETRRTNTEGVAGVSTSEEEGGGGGNLLATIFLPLAVTSWLLGGGMGLILDSTVGEKERQTIENLLVTPASRMGIVMGKMTVVFIASMAVMSLWLLEGLLLNAFSVGGSELLAEEGVGFTEAIDILLNSSGNIVGLMLALVGMIIPFTIMLNGLVMAWCAYAANYREANLFMALVQLGLPASVLLTIFSLPPEINNAVYGVPFFGTIVGIRDLFSQSLPVAGLTINIITSIIYAGLAISFAAWVFGREWSLTRGLQ